MVKTLLFFINEWGNIVVPFDLLEGISSKKGVGLQHWGEAKRCCFVCCIVWVMTITSKCQSYLKFPTPNKEGGKIQ